MPNFQTPTPCSVEDWTLKDLALAVQNQHYGHISIEVPKFQRGKRWTMNQQKSFIDSIKRGYPVGSMLFYARTENNQTTYSLVDGLQRCTCIKKYISEPTHFLEVHNISDDVCLEILNALNTGLENIEIIRNTILVFLQNLTTLGSVQFFDLADQIAVGLHIDATNSQMRDVINSLSNFYQGIQQINTIIENAKIPVLVYKGNQNNLPEIFERINSGGTQLNRFEVFAASWPSRKYSIRSSEIIEKVAQKYDSFVSDGYVIEDYDHTVFVNAKELSIYEFVFGLAKYLNDKYAILHFDKESKPDQINKLSFELLDACFNDKNSMGTLYEPLSIINVNLLVTAIENAISFVENSISVITQFKGNTRVEGNILHSEYMILSMIAYVFRIMYKGTDYSSPNNEWSRVKNSISKNLLLYYVFDIIDNTWSEGGTSKIYKYVRENRYSESLSESQIANAITRHFDRTMLHQECDRAASPSKEDITILNVIYKNTFSAHQQLSGEKFDIEHIAPKAQLRKILERINGKIAISNIANFCYLPETDNRVKRDKNIYQANFDSNKLTEIETKYTFTKREDLDWMEESYQTEADFVTLRNNYENFCKKRFDVIKKKFLISLGFSPIEINNNTTNQN